MFSLFYIRFSGWEDGLLNFLLLKSVFCLSVFNHNIIFLDSSTVEHPAVNRRVVGSNPTRGVKPVSRGNTQVAKGGRL